MSRSKIVIALLMLSGLAVFFGLGLHQTLTLENLQASRADLLSWYAQQPATALVVFFCGYVAVTALS